MKNEITLYPSLSAIAASLGVNRMTLWCWVKRGHIKSATRNGRTWTADPREVERVFSRKLRAANKKPHPGRPFVQHPRAAKEQETK